MWQHYIFDIRTVGVLYKKNPNSIKKFKGGTNVNYILQLIVIGRFFMWINTTIYVIYLFVLNLFFFY